MLHRSYQITKGVLEELRQLGLSEAALKYLSTLDSQLVCDRKTLVSHLDKAGEDVITSPERKAVIAYSRLSVFRLERIIPNRGLREWIEALVFAVVIALFVRTFVIAPYTIPSGSMLPTIFIGDYIFATKYDYGIPVPFSDAKLFSSPVKRGDIVIFPKPGDPSENYIKRVIGLGGETIEMRGIQVFINDQPLNEPYAFYNPEVLRAFKVQGQTPPGFGPVRVPEGKLFMMGDNRFNSQDSRFWGFLNMKDVRGRGRFIWWSHDPGESLFSGYKLGRIGRALQ